MNATTNDIETLREGDIFRWAYREADYSRHDPYWCKSRIAVVTAALRFRDTFWGSGSSESFSFSPDNLDKIEVTRIANFDELEERCAGDGEYYDAADIVDIRHANSSHGNFYIRKGAKRSQSKMLASAQYRLERAESAARSAHHDAERAREAIARIQSGNLEGWL